MEIEFQNRLDHHMDELKWLYYELYDNPQSFASLLEQMGAFYKNRNSHLRNMDGERIKNPDWYMRRDRIGMMLYVDLFSKNLKGLTSRLDYLEQMKINYLHLMPLLKMPANNNDGGYAVSDYRMVDDALGNMDDLEELASECRKKDICICLDFVINHTSDEHPWSVAAKQGDREAMEHYITFEDDSMPKYYDQTVPEVFPGTAPGNFTFNKEMGRFVMTTFNPYQWDLNYKNPVVFNEMVCNILYLANKGIDVFRIDAVPYIWKQPGTSCRNLKQVHTIMRMIRIVVEIVCPGILLKGEVVMSPQEVAPYFGVKDKPECHILYNVTTMVAIWNSLATRDTRLLCDQIETISALPLDFCFVNYVRCHDDIGWGLDEGLIQSYGFNAQLHKEFLYHFFSGSFEGSFARGELYNFDARTKDARNCGTAASLCGIQAAQETGFGGNSMQIEAGIRRDLLVHGFMMAQNGIPVIYSGDEIAACNNYDYKNNPDKAMDSRFLHRSQFDWEKAQFAIENPDSIEGKMFYGLKKLISIRTDNPIFDGIVPIQLIPSGSIHTIAIKKQDSKNRFIAIFNFSEYTVPIGLEVLKEFNSEKSMTDILKNTKVLLAPAVIDPYEMIWIMQSL